MWQFLVLFISIEDPELEIQNAFLERATFGSFGLQYSLCKLIVKLEPPVLQEKHTNTERDESSVTTGIILRSVMYRDRGSSRYLVHCQISSIPPPFVFSQIGTRNLKQKFKLTSEIVVAFLHYLASVRVRKRKKKLGGKFDIISTY